MQMTQQGQQIYIQLLSLTLEPSGGVFFCEESFVLQHTSAIFEWIYCMLIMLFYGTFAFEFGDVSGETLMVLSRGGPDRSFSSDHKVEAVGGSNHHQVEGFPMVEASWQLATTSRVTHKLMWTSLMAVLIQSAVTKERCCRLMGGIVVPLSSASQAKTLSVSFDEMQRNNPPVYLSSGIRVYIENRSLFFAVSRPSDVMSLQSMWVLANS